MNLYVVDRGLEPGRKALKKVLREAQRKLFVVDCRGLASALLSHEDVQLASSRRAMWVNLGDMRNPPRILEFQTNHQGLNTAASVVNSWARLLGLPVMSGDKRLLQTFCGRVFRSAGGSGEVEPHWFSLADLRASMANDEIIRWAWPKGENAGAARRARTRLLRVLDEALGYPHVAALTISRSLLRWQEMEDSDIVWVELPRRYFENAEWKLLTVAFLARLGSLPLSSNGNGASLEPSPLPVLLYPPTDALQSFMDAPSPFGAPALVVLPLHPSGAAPSIFSMLQERGTPYAVEFMNPSDHQSARSWSAAVRSSVDASSEERPVQAFSVTNGSGARVPPQVLHQDIEEEPLGEALDDLRRRDARGRPALSSRCSTAFASIHNGWTGRLGADDPYLRLCRPSALRFAWSSLRMTGGPASGLDKVTSLAFSSRLEDELAALAKSLSEGSYEPLPVKWTTIPKRSGGRRKIGVTALKDRVVQRAFLTIVEPYFEPHFSDYSYGFRSHRGAHHAVSAVLGAWGRGRSVAVRLDVESCFETLPHELILSKFAERVPSSRLLALLAKWLRVGTGHFAITGLPGVGVVQGYVLAPFLSNIVMTELDEAIEEAGIDFARYADDLTLLVDSEEEAQAAISMVEDVLRGRMRMRLNQKKTRVARLEEGFGFLGFHVGGPQMLAMIPDRVDSACEELESQEVPEVPAAADRWLRRLQLQLDGFSNYFCRLGMTDALDEQFARLLGTAAKLRDGLPEPLRALPGWESLPTVEYLRERHGAFDESAMRRSGKTKLETHSYSGMESGESKQWLLSMAVESGTLATASSSPSDTEADQDDDTGLGVESADKTIVIFEERASLRPDENGIALVRRGTELVRVPYSSVDMLVIESHSVSLSAHAAWELSSRNVPLVMASPSGDQITVLAAPGGNRGFIRAAQAKMLETDAVRRAGIAMLAAKVSNQASLLRYLARAPGRKKLPLGKKLSEAATEIRLLSEMLGREGEARLAMPQDKLAPILMGYEGKAAAIYWQAVASALPEELAYPGRRTRGADDPLNMALNYVYGILYADVWRAVVYAGLDPGIGIVHCSPRSNGGLVYDLVEELRAPLADRVVMGLIGRGWEPTSIRSESAALRKSDRRILARAYLSKRRSSLRQGRVPVKIGDLPKRQALALRTLILGEAEKYQAFRYRW